MLLCIHKRRHATNFVIFTDCALEDLGVMDTTPGERCIGLQNSAQFPGGVVCYSGVIPGSLAVYVCNSIIWKVPGSENARVMGTGVALFRSVLLVSCACILSCTHNSGYNIQ